mmetsp:Transcript_30957/g.45902  ORF Transcript_30957/g.45902 Transcript_30957/m.45902 type:complete len:552 (-) Transcript_30957:77-1732(-)|eukprot:CAMPEP_0194033324 /NCGR_PEP_ID=MMETSP0009_2-20130614/6069_1 /TAXON_ID=210454 /ORGANISM="Grammatophora oceanica, Strain CCMP 410" /LENGTH=551 /DNA_ID=CAMNT_0038674007 /DNA_START=313 /DNA_END=1968 /DNA_ORIENTATION=-
MSESPTNKSFLLALPPEIQVNLLSFLRAYDLANVQQTCRAFASRAFIQKVVQHTATHVYPRELTEGWERTYNNNQQQQQGESSNNKNHLYTFEALRHIEWLVVARVLSRPEPVSGGGFYVSKSWCRTALKWLEVQEAEREQQQQLRAASSTSSTPSSKRAKKKLSKKQQRMRNRRLSDASPPWPNVNSDLVCPHDHLQHAPSTRTARARRRLLDKQAWKTLKKLYPESIALPAMSGECLQCALEKETTKRAADKAASAAKEERKLCLSDKLVRGLYTRSSRGVPVQALRSSSNVASLSSSSGCPLQPGLYHVLPRSWLFRWRRYLKTGEGGPVPPPDASVLLCDAHRIPLLPPHLEAWLHGETLHLFDTKPKVSVAVAQQRRPSVVDAEMRRALRGAGLSEAELHAQVRAMALVEHQQQQAAVRPTQRTTTVDKEQLDRDNQVVVEVLTDEEYTALEKWWPCQAKFSLKFQIVPSDDDFGGHEVLWSTFPCRACDASSKSCLYSRSCSNTQNHHHRSSVTSSSLLNKKQSPSSSSSNNKSQRSSHHHDLEL